MSSSATSNPAGRQSKHCGCGGRTLSRVRSSKDLHGNIQDNFSEGPLSLEYQQTQSLKRANKWWRWYQMVIESSHYTATETMNCTSDTGLAFNVYTKNPGVVLEPTVLIMGPFVSSSPKTGKQNDSVLQNGIVFARTLRYHRAFDNGAEETHHSRFFSLLTISWSYMAHHK